MESQNGEELDFDFDFLFYYADRNCLTRPTMVTIDDELYGVIMDNITLIMKNFCMTSPYI